MLFNAKLTPKRSSGPVPYTSPYEFGNIAVVWPWYTPIAPELTLPLMLG